MIKGVNKFEEKIIKSILQNYPYQFYYYGSRVKGDFTKSSDLDILLKSSDKIPCEILNQIDRQFNESKIPYVVNISEFTQMDKNFYELIKSDLVEILFS